MARIDEVVAQAKDVAWGNYCELQESTYEMQPVTLDEIRERLQLIRSMDSNDQAHAQEDLLYHDVLATIADGAPNAPELAAEALKARAIKFDRWYA